jgi:glycosyltransferase involved in cell wall biosynthesis
MNKEILKHLGKNDLEAIQTEEGIIGGYKKDRKTLSIIIPTYKRKEILLENIESLRPVWKDIEIVIVDDCSPDNTEDAINDYVRGKEINLKYLRNETNKGTLESVNKGIRESSNDIVFTIADDTIIINPTMALRLINDNITMNRIIATRLFSQLEATWNFKTRLRALLYKIPAMMFAGEIYNYNGNKAKVVDYCNGLFAFDRRINIFYNEKDYIKNFFRSETEFQADARRKGIKLAYYPQVALYHKDMTPGGLRTKNKKASLIHSVYNHVIFLKRNFGFSKYYKIPFYFMLKTVTHPHLTGQIIMTFDRSFRNIGLE